MLRKILFGLVVSVFILGISQLSFAMLCGSKHSEHDNRQQLAQAEMGNMQMNTETAAAETIKKAEEVGNKICPVMGTKIKKGEEVKYEYNGKIYNFCCPMCIDEFKKDPEKYIKKVEKEIQAQSKEGMKEEPKEHEGMMHMEGMHEGHQH